MRDSVAQPNHGKHPVLYADGRKFYVCPFGTPNWMKMVAADRTAFPDVEIILGRSHDIAVGQGAGWSIDCLHIDGDHSYEGSRQDFLDYKPLMAPAGVIVPCAPLFDGDSI